MNQISKTLAAIFLFSFTISTLHFLISRIVSSLSFEKYIFIYLSQFLLSILIYLVSSYVKKRQAENLGYYFLASTTLKTIIFYLLISCLFFPNEVLTRQNKSILSLQFLLFLGLDVYLTARLLNSKDVN